MVNRCRCVNLQVKGIPAVAFTGPNPDAAQVDKIPMPYLLQYPVLLTPYVAPGLDIAIIMHAAGTVTNIND